MRLEVVYETRYEFAPAVAGRTSALRLRPRTRRGLTVLSSDLSCEPGLLAGSYVDGWGTAVDLVEAAQPHGAAVFSLHANVVTEPIEFDDVPAPDEASLYSRDSARVRRSAVDAIGGWTLGDEGRSWTAVESALVWLPQRLFYVVGATDAQTPIETVLQLGHGVCQDFAHVFLALLRRWGWCARYVSGYMFSDVTRAAERIEAQAMHAWVEVYRPGSGWIGMDATAGVYVDDRYVPVGYGRDYDDVRPIRGVLRGWTLQKQSAQLQMMRSSEQ